jgi:RHS repeat-associated protein
MHVQQHMDTFIQRALPASSIWRAIVALLILSQLFFSYPAFAQTSLTTTHTEVHSYQYNPIGNILNTTENGVYSYTTDPTSFANPHAPTSVGGQTHTYDKNGNLLSDGDSTYVWNTDNTLASVTKGGITTTYTYDATGQRTSLTTPTSTTLYPNKFYNVETTTTGDTKTTKHIYAGSDLVATIETTDTNGHPHSTTFYHHPDHLGSSSVITSGADTTTEPTTVQALAYYPYGKVRVNEQTPSADSGQTFNEQKKFTGYEYDTSTNLSYANARYYDQDRGQFVSQDPAVLSLGASQITQRLLADPQQQNTYSYARNNPLVFTDPSGNAVYAVAKGIEGNEIGTHVFLVIAPDANKVCTPDNPGFWTIGGYVGNEGNLIKAQNAQSDLNVAMFGYSGTDGIKQMGVKKDMVEVTRPEGLTDAEFIDRVMHEYNAYSEDAAYDPFAQRGSNSNNFATTLLLGAGVSNMPWQGNAPGLDPGFGTAMSSDYKKATGQMLLPGGSSPIQKGVASYVSQQTSQSSQAPVKSSSKK